MLILGLAPLYEALVVENVHAWCFADHRISLEILDANAAVVHSGLEFALLVCAKC